MDAQFKKGILDICVLSTYMHVSEQGRRRKYYRITDKGRSHLKELRKDWKAFKEVADRLIGGDVDE